MKWGEEVHTQTLALSRLSRVVPSHIPAPSWVFITMKRAGKGCESCPQHSGGSRVSPGQAAGRCHSGRTLLPRLAVPSSSHKIGPVPFQNSPAAMRTCGELYTSPVPAAECPLRGAGHLPSPRGTFFPWHLPSVAPQARRLGGCIPRGQPHIPVDPVFL